MILPRYGHRERGGAHFQRKADLRLHRHCVSAVWESLSSGFSCGAPHVRVRAIYVADAIFSALTSRWPCLRPIKVLNWLATMYKGLISLDTPMCYAISFILLFTIGGLTGVVLGCSQPTCTCTTLLRWSRISLHMWAARSWASWRGCTNWLAQDSGKVTASSGAESQAHSYS